MFTHVLGAVHSQRNIKAQEEGENFGIVIDQDIIDEFILESGLGNEYLSEVEEKIAGKVDTIARLDFYDRMERLQTIFAENAPSGLGLRDFVDRIGKDDLMKELGLIGESPYYIETVYRTNFTTAHTAGRWRSAQASKLVSMLKFFGVSDNRQTEDICKPLTDTVKPKDDPIWKTITPPNHFSCRSGILELTKSYVKINNIKEKDPSAFDIPKDFATNPADSDGWMKPTKAMKSRLKDYESSNS